MSHRRRKARERLERSEEFVQHSVDEPCNEYVQCLLVKSNRSQTSWIPAQFAKLGKVLKLRLDGVWNNGWKVVATYGKHTEHPHYSDDFCG